MTPGSVLLGRPVEAARLRGLIQDAHLGRSAALVVLGDPGIGKSALLAHLVRIAAGCRLLRVAGVESQMELAFAGLHQLCGPLLDRLEQLPRPQADALGTALGTRSGPPPDRALIALAVLSLLAEGASDQPLVCVVDDAQWLDDASAQTLTLVARRLAAEAVVMVFAARPVPEDQGWAGLPQLTLEGLADSDAEALLKLSITGPLDRRVRRRLLAEAHGNPLALVELPRWFSLAEMTFGPGSARKFAAGSLTSRMEDGFRRQLAPLPQASRDLLLIAAAEPLGDLDLLWRAAEQLGIGPDAAGAAESAGLIELKGEVRFRHPLLRSVTYRSAASSERQAAHAALAAATNPDVDPDRRAWHRAQAADGPDEAIAAELEHSAARAVAYGGQPAAAAFYERSAILTPDPGDRVRRQLEAAQALLRAGRFDAALNLLAVAERGPLTALQRGRVDVLRAQILFASNRGNEALPLLLVAAGRLEPLDVELALDSYLDALTAALFAGRLASGAGPVEVARAARNAPMTAHPRPRDVLLKAVSARFADGYPAAVPLLERAVQDFESEALTLDEGVRFLWLAAVVASDLWDDQAWDGLTRRHLQIVRDAGALSALPLALTTRVFVDLFSGDLADASVLVEEILVVTDATHSTMAPYGAIGLAAFQGRDVRATPTVEAGMRDVEARGEGIGVSLMHWAHALMCNGLGRYAEALTAARLAAAYPEEMLVSNWGLIELVEAAIRAGEPGTAAAAFERLSETTQASSTEWALGVAARAEAQLRSGDRAEDLYREAIDRFGRTRLRTELARSQLLYGEWLRRAGRRTDARGQLRSAHESLTAMGAGAFAERARQELAATGETVRKRSVDTLLVLTAQELHIARLAADGLTNPEIGAKLFISPRTVEWHMGKVFSKLGVTARGQLGEALRLAMS